MMYDTLSTYIRIFYSVLRKRFCPKCVENIIVNFILEILQKREEIVRFVIHARSLRLIDILFTKKNSVLKEAVKQGDLLLVKGLLAKEGEKKGENLEELLILAVEKGDIDIVRILVENGANIDSAFIKAVDLGGFKLVEYLVQSGADIRRNDDEALKIASYHGYLDIVVYLVENGADPKNEEAYRMSSRYGYFDVSSYLRS